MKKITIRGKQYQCPENWDEVTLKQQIKVSSDAEKISNDSLKRIAILSGYANIPLSELKQIPISELTDVFKHIAFVNQPIPNQPLHFFEFKTKKYYVGQNLLEMQFQDFISIENVLTDYSGNTYLALPTIIAIMAKQMKDDGILETIDDYDVRKRSIEFQDLPIGIANGLSVFFYQSVSTSQILTGLFSNPEMLVEMKISEAEDTLKQLAGRGLLTRCAIGILRYCLKYIRRRQTLLFTSTPQK